MLKLVYFVPESHLELTKQAIFEAGAGKFIDDGSHCHYQNCAWQVKGLGQFLPMENANPALGKIGQLEIVEEWRVEVLVAEENARAVKQALLTSHLYEEVAYEFYQIIEI